VGYEPAATPAGTSGRKLKHMLVQESVDEALAPFFEKHLITGVRQTIKSGKEASVYLCEADPSTGVPYLAAKIYRPRESRTFKNDAVYHAGEFIGDRRTRKAMAQKSRHGRRFQFTNWVEREFQTLRHLRAFGAIVPRPYGRTDTALLMQFVGDEAGAAVPLNRVTLDREEAEVFFELLLRNIELWLSLGHIHADLSPFNVLYHEGDITVIDFPQAVSAEENPNAYMLLQRDIENVCRYFARYGVHADPSALAGGLWSRYVADEF
jgi:RIO kinase 1